MLKKILIAVAVLVIGVLALALAKPDTFTVQRSISIKAPPEKIFAIVSDFHHWTEWSPWEGLDASMNRTLTGALKGKGAVYAWDGNGKVGAGRMEILDDAPPKKVEIKLDFIKPFEGHNIATFTMQPKGDATEVTWVMTGPAPFVSRLMQVFVSMDSMIGKDFEAGLANLKTITEK